MFDLNYAKWILGSLAVGGLSAFTLLSSASAETIVGDPTVPSFGTGGSRAYSIQRPQEVVIVRTPLHKKELKNAEHFRPSTHLGAADSLELRSGARAPEPRRAGSADSLNVRSGGDHVDLLPGGGGEEVTL